MTACRYAAIDIGTVTCRLLIADVVGGKLTVLRRECAITNLGEGVDATGYLKREAMERVEHRIAFFRELIDGYRDAEHPCVHVIAMATSASRDAKNSDEFVSLLARYDIRLSVIPGEREAELTFLGASSAFPHEHLLVADIGGGSTELIAGIGGQRPEFIESFNIGCRRVTEKFFASDPPSIDERARADAWMRPQFDTLFDDMAVCATRIDRFVAVAGTATSVSAIDQALDPYDSSRVHGQVVSKETLDAVYLKLASVSLVERKKIVGLDPARASVIVAGMVILEALMALTGQASFTVSESDILQGIILDDASSHAS